MDAEKLHILGLLADSQLGKNIIESYVENVKKSAKDAAELGLSPEDAAIYEKTHLYVKSKKIFMHMKEEIGEDALRSQVDKLKKLIMRRAGYMSIDVMLCDTALCNFADKKRRDPLIFNFADVEAMYRWRDLARGQWACTPGTDDHCEPENVDAQIRNSIEGKLIEYGKGHLVLAGGAIHSLAKRYRPSDYDFFFYDLSTNDADKLLVDLIEMVINEHGRDYIYFERSQYVLTVRIGDIGFPSRDLHYDIKYQFIRRLYKTKGQILHGFDIAGAKAGFDWNNGLYFTIDGAVAFATNAIMLDLTQRSTSFGARLQKYARGKRFKFYFPNISGEIMCGQNIINTTDGKLIRDSNEKHFQFHAYTGNYSFSDYENEGGAYQNCLLMDKWHGVRFVSQNHDDIMKLPDAVIEESLFRGSLWYNKGRYTMPNVKPETAKKFMGDQYPAFVTAAYVDFDYNAAAALWQGRRDYFMRRGREIAAHINEHRWKIDDPGSQSFGKFSPILADPRDWYDPNPLVGPPFRTGIAPECVRMFRLCMARMLIPDDIVDVLLRAWLYMLADDALRRLLG